MEDDSTSGSRRCSRATDQAVISASAHGYQKNCQRIAWLALLRELSLRAAVGAADGAMDSRSMEGPMPRRLVVIVLCVIALAPAVLAQPETTPIPVKEYLDAVGAIDIIIRVYDAPQGGTILYQVTQSVIAQEGIFDEVLDLPTALLTTHPQVFIEFATAAAPGAPRRRAHAIHAPGRARRGTAEPIVYRCRVVL